MGLRTSIGRKSSVRRRFIGSTFYTTPGAFSGTVPVGADSYDAIVVGGGGVPPGNAYYSSGGGMAIQRNRATSPGQTYAGTVGAAGGASTAFGMTANPGAAANAAPWPPGGTASGGDVNLAGSAATGGGSGGGCPSPAWTQTPSAPYADSGGPYIHPSYKGIMGPGGAQNPGAGGLIAGGGSVNYPPGTGGVFVFWFATEVV